MSYRLLASIALAQAAVGALLYVSGASQVRPEEARVVTRTFWSEYSARSSHLTMRSWFGEAELPNDNSFTCSTEWALEETQENAPDQERARITRDYLKAVQTAETVVDGEYLGESDVHSLIEGTRVVFEWDDGSYSTRPTNADA